MTKLINQTKAQSEVNSANHDLGTEYNIYNIYFLYRFIHFIMVKVKDKQLKSSAQLRERERGNYDYYLMTQ